MRATKAIVDLPDCGRCGRLHRELSVRRFKRPGIFGWWGICPRTKEPILLDNFKSPEKAEILKRRLTRLGREGIGK